MLNIKNYNIKKNVHIYRQGELNIAYDVNSGSLHIIDSNTYNLIEEMKRIQDENASRLDDDLKVINEAGKDLSDKVKAEILSELEELQTNGLFFRRK
jgi:uncharacterized protein